MRTGTKRALRTTIHDKTWNIIADCVTSVYQETEDGKYRYLGYDHTGDLDENGHYMVDADDYWIHINGILVCYEDKGQMETEDGTVFKGDVKARLNGKEDIIIHVQWDAVEGEDAESWTGYVTGYDFVADTELYTAIRKGSQKFKTGDRVSFLFDYYDENGELTDTSTYGSTLVVTRQSDLIVQDEPLPDGNIKFLGILTDVFQRQIMTEVIDAHIGD